MPPEGPNKSEELLKRYANERREQAPKLSMHPATRRLLQGEVAREFGKAGRAEQRGWAMWLSILRGRLAICTAVCVLAVTGISVWWNNQKPPTLEMAKSDSSTDEFAQLTSKDIDEVKLLAKKENSGAAAAAPVQFENESRRLALAPSAPSAIQPEIKAKLQNAAPAEGFGASRSALTLDDALSLARTTSTLSSTNLLALGAIANPNTSPSLGTNSSTVYFETASVRLTVSNQANLAFAYNAPADGLASQQGVLPPVATLGDATGKNLFKLAETEKLAAEPALIAARPDSGLVDRARRGGTDPQAPPVQPRATAAPLSRALPENLTEEKRQQSTVAQTRSELESQPSVTRPGSPEQLARFYRQSAAPTDEYSRQKALRDLGRSDAGPRVLLSFSIEQTGNAVRVVDADGSVYDGKVEAPVVTEFDSDLAETLAESKDQPAREKPVALRSTLAPPTEGYSFRAAGSNLTLRQIVVVNGRFSAGTNTMARRGSAGVAGGVSTRSAVVTGPASKSSAVSNRANGPQPSFGGRYGLATNQPATIEGTVTIGVTNQQWFRAVRDSR